VRKVAAESIFTVAHVVMNAGIKTSFNMFFGTFGFSRAFFNGKILVCAKIFDSFELVFELFEFKEFLVIHFVDKKI
jgi:hypothetical protein